jgi:LPPG:FO 2-phospho-L-lactate transferase
VVVVLAGGTGGAKLAAGFADELGPGELTVVANTADDVEFYGVHVSPDPDLVTWWLAGLVDERGWGIEGDSFRVVDAIAESGRPAWFRLGDRDLAMCMVRTAELREGRRLTAAHAAVVDAVRVQSRVLPMSDDPVRTWVKVRGAWHPFQEFMIVERAEGPLEGLEFRGLGHAAPSPEVLDAVASAEVVVIGPSNPIISIRPILELPGMREALRSSGAPVVAVSPFLDGHSIKGPSDLFMEFVRLPLGTAGALAAYEGVIDGLVADAPLSMDSDSPGPVVPVHVTDTLMADADGRRRLAATTLEFARSLG